MSRKIPHFFSALALLMVLPTSAPSEMGGMESGQPDSLLGLEARRLDGGKESLFPQDPGLVAEIERLLAEPRPREPSAGLAR